MPIAMQCSLCGGYYKEYYSNTTGNEKNNKKYNALFTIDINTQLAYQKRKVIDLCQICKKSFEEWLENRKEGDK